MGVRFYDKENMMSGDDYTTTRRNCNCNTCNPHVSVTPTSTATAANTSTSSTQTASTSTSSCYSGNNINLQKSGIHREIVGNCKEVRIEDNVHNLRIIGNNNRIRMAVNVGDLTIVGNNTRLKIKENHGHINYTGNDGRICLGKDSTEQLIDYNGCNGVLKVVNSRKFNQDHQNVADGNDESSGTNDNNKKTTNISTEKICTSINKQFIGINTKQATSSSSSSSLTHKKPKQKAYSYSGSSSSDLFKCQIDFNNIFNRKRSMPNITTVPTHHYTGKADSNPIQPPKRIINNFGNIVISNSANVCISPYYC